MMTLQELVKTAKRGTPDFEDQDRPESVKRIYHTLKREHPSMPAEMKARISAKFGKSGVQHPGPPYKGDISSKYSKADRERDERLRDKEKTAQGLWAETTTLTQGFHKLAAYFDAEKVEDHLSAGVLPRDVMDRVRDLAGGAKRSSVFLRHPVLTGIPTLGIGPSVAKSRALDRISRELQRDPKIADLLKGRWQEQRVEAERQRTAEAQARQMEAEWEKAQATRDAATEVSKQLAGAYLGGQAMKYRGSANEF